MAYSPYECPGNGNPLLLAARQLSSLGPHSRLIAAGQGGHKAVNVGLHRCRRHLLHAHDSAVVAVLDVLGDGTLEKGWLLGHDAKMGPERGQVRLPDVQPVQIHGTGRDVIKPVDIRTSVLEL